MHPQITAWVAELDACTRRAHQLADRAGDTGFARRPPSGKWSLGEHLAHLVITTDAYLPILRDLASANASASRDAARTYRRDVLGGLLAWVLEPPVRALRSKTPPAFEPAAAPERAATLRDFDERQGALRTAVEALDGLDLNAARVASPFAANAHYNGWTAITILTVHQRRHLWLAEHA